jgi:hypothetical protein
MKLFRLSQNVNGGYDTYDSAVVAAESEEAAVLIEPSGSDCYVLINGTFHFKYDNGRIEREAPMGWCDPENVKAEYIGEAKLGTEAGVICASFNAG